MRFLSLRFPAFGPFTDFSIDLSEGEQGFHVLYGANEAGKSSSLRAIRQLLFGMDHSSSDAFRHPMPSLRLGALLQRRDGTTCEFVRRKALKNSLRQADDQTPLSDDILTEFISGMDRTQFMSMFGIDHRQLRQGGEEIARGKGQLAETLFAAAAGVKHLRRLVNELVAGHESIYKPRGKDQEFPKLLRHLSEARTELARLQYPSEQWQQLDEQLKTSQKQGRRTHQKLHDVRLRQQHLMRIQAALPILNRWEQARAELASCQDAPLLRADFTAALQAARKEFDVRTHMLDQARTEVERAQSRLTENDLNAAVLAAEESIKNVQQELGSYQKARSDRAGLLQRQEQLRLEIKELIQQFGRGDMNESAVRWQLSVDRKLRIQKLSQQALALQELDQAKRSDLAKSQRAIAETQATLDRTPRSHDLSLLKATLHRWRGAGDLDEKGMRVRQRWQQQQQLLEQRLSRLNFFSEGLDTLRSLPVPPAERIAADERERERIETLRERWHIELERVAADISEKDRRLAQLESLGVIPSPEDLTKSREERDALWETVRLAWQGEKAFDQPRTMELSAAIRHSDELADRLWTVADRSAKAVELRSQRTPLQETRQRLLNQLDVLEKEQADWQKNWNTLWSRLSGVPGSPEEMRGWLRQRDDLLELAEEVDQLHAEVNLQRQERERAVADLRMAAMGMDVSIAPEASFAVAMSVVEAVVLRNDTDRQTTERLTHELQRAQGEFSLATAAVAENEARRNQWLRDWQLAIEPLGVDSSANVEEVAALLAVAEGLSLKTRERDELQGRVDGIDRDAALFHDITESLCRSFSLDVDGRDSVARVALLQDLLKTSTAAQTRQMEQQEALQAKQKEWEKRRLAHDQAHAALLSLAREAQTTEIEELPQLAAASDRRRQCERALRDVEGQLVELAAGQGLEQFAAEAAQFHPDQLAADRQFIEQELETLQSHISTIDQSIGQVREKLQQIQGRGDAAEQASQCELLATELQESVHQYGVQKLAAAILQRGIERYRDRHQSPLIARASHLFNELTRGSFEGLRTDLNEQGIPVLLGVRARERSIVPIEGMSDGTCDQLYLALRIAGLEGWLEHHEPMPLILDDLLLNFDDARAEAALKVLGELARQTQVLFFTHHERLVELAGRAVAPDQLRIHSLLR